MALWAAVNLLWVGFDLTYIPLRNFWLQRTLYPLPSLPLRLPLPFLPDVTPLVDPIKGIEPHRETQAYLEQFQRLDQALLQGPPGRPTAEQERLLARQVKLTQQMIDSNPFLAANASGTLEKIKNLLRQRSDQSSAKQAAATLLGPDWLERHPWGGERIFWQEKVLPLVATNYWRSIDENGQPTDHFWFYDLVAFQSVFALDILLRALRARRRLPGLSWRDALLRRWIDLPLLLPFWRWLRLVPVVERLQSSELINLEPLRAVISRGVVAMLAVELFEVLALQLVDGLQQLVRSRRWPERLRALRSHQSVIQPQEREMVELVRIWAPLLLNRVAPRLEPELQGVLAMPCSRACRTRSCRAPAADPAAAAGGAGAQPPARQRHGGEPAGGCPAARASGCSSATTCSWNCCSAASTASGRNWRRPWRAARPCSAPRRSCAPCWSS